GVAAASRIAAFQGGVPRQPVEDLPHVARNQGSQRDASTIKNAVPSLRRGDARDLVGDGRRRRCGIDHDLDRLHAGRLVLAYHELAVPGARAPVDTPQRIARAGLADAEELIARPGSRRGCGSLELAHKAPIRQRPETWKHEGDLSVAALATGCEEPERIARADTPPGRAEGAAP